MRKLWRGLCFLVLAFSSVSRGQNDTTVTQETLTSPTIGADEPQNESNATLQTPLYNHTSANTTDLPSTNLTAGGEKNSVTDTTEEVSTTMMGGANEDTATVSMETGSTLSTPARGGGHSSWGYVLLVLIIVAIIILCIILYFLRRVSRTYSFDLHRQVPSNHHNDPIGTFEPVYLDDLAPKDQGNTEDVPTLPVSNGTTVQTEERESNGEIAPKEQSEENGLETSPGNTDPPLMGDLAEKTSSPSESTSIFFDALNEEQQNENNNNPSVCSSDPFVEINLEDQLLTYPEAPSSVLPFSPFSFSSSSSSSS
ncbi:hypothetical protein PBY51_005804 [Eleginops maclovinus]|uniref:Uncharacterized protein n=1 Tax=Eleginops maclovinus TaxID=56733 RepID=A0AAN7WNE8_ELEMC|nr:hypothetical protein PBY51_005804 [Eleginops maclovinus]